MNTRLNFFFPEVQRNPELCACFFIFKWVVGGITCRYTDQPWLVYVIQLKRLETIQNWAPMVEIVTQNEHLLWSWGVLTNSHDLMSPSHSEHLSLPVITYPRHSLGLRPALLLGINHEVASLSMSTIIDLINKKFKTKEIIFFHQD